jgi:superfamily II DNA or RNA helicase
LVALDALHGDARRVVLATGRLVGEGFGHPALDTLVLGMPVAWKGMLRQYAGRLHREYAGKTGARVIDYVDGSHPVLLRMWEKRQRGYRGMGYQVRPERRSNWRLPELRQAIRLPYSFRSFEPVFGPSHCITLPYPMLGRTRRHS